MASEQDNSKTKTTFFKKFTISEAILLAVIPIFGYSLLFAFEYGYFNVFQLPLQFINFDIAEIFIVTSSLFVLLVAILFYMDIFFMPFFKNRVPQPLRMHIGSAIPIYAVFIALALIYSKALEEFLPYLIGMIFFTFHLFLPPLLTRKVKGSYIEKFVALEEIKRKNREKASGKSLTNIIINKISKEFFFAVLIYAMIIFIAYNAGRGIALTQEKFRVVNTDPEMVVLYIKADRAIVSHFDRKSREIEPVFKVIYFDNDSFEFRLEEVGPLKLKIDTLSANSTSTSTTRN